MRTHIKVVAIINIIFGALGVLGGLGVVLGGAFGSLFSGELIGAVVGVATSVVVGVILLAVSALRVAAGIGLMNGQQWARYSIILISVLGLLRFPFGTIFSVYSLWVLLSSDGARQFTETTV